MVTFQLAVTFPAVLFVYAQGAAAEKDPFET
jgi:hypothetical protein